MDVEQDNDFLIYLVSFLGSLSVLPGNIISALLMDRMGRLKMIGELAGMPPLLCSGPRWGLKVFSGSFQFLKEIWQRKQVRWNPESRRHVDQIPAPRGGRVRPLS